MEVFFALRAYYKRERSMLALAIGCLLFSTGLGIVYPMLLRYLIDDVIMRKQFGQVPALSFIMIAVTAVKAASYFAFGHYGTRAGNRLAYNLREGMYKKLQELSFSYYDKARTGDVMSRVTGDLETVRHFMGIELPHVINFFACILFSTTVMFALSWQLTLLLLATMPLLGVIAVRLNRFIQPAFRDIRTAVSEMTTTVQENVSGMRTVKSFAREPHEVEKFANRSESYKERNIETANILARYIPMMEWTVNMSVVILSAAGGYLVLQDRLSLGELIAFFGLVWYLVAPLWATGHHINVYTQTKASAERLLDILLHPAQAADKRDAAEVPRGAMKGHIVMEGVTFAYDGSRHALEDVSLNAPPGTIIGIVGGTGSGKTTMIQLLMRAYRVKEGSIKVDGIAVEDWRAADLRSDMAFVFQETFLFSSTIRNNIAYGAADADDEQIIAAARLAQAHDFIMAMPLGYDTVVGERGLGLSGGQKQRIAIARALIKRPKLLVLDDATSAVDTETEQEIQRGLRGVDGCTTFIIAHRISSLRHADEIIVLHEGKVAQRGTHQTLLASDGPYANAWRMQMEATEDAAATVEGKEGEP